MIGGGGFVFNLYCRVIILLILIILDGLIVSVMLVEKFNIIK